MSAFKKYLFCLAILFVVSTSTAEVFIKSRGSINQIIDKMASTLVYSSKLEVNGAPGSVSIYTLHDLNALALLAKYLKLDLSLYSENGFRVKLTKEQGGGMIFAIADGGSLNNSEPVIIHFVCAESSNPQWLFPEISMPANANIQFSVMDSSRNMRMCTYTGEESVKGAIINIETELLKNGWECVTPGNRATSLFFAKGDSVVLVSATPLQDSDGCTVLIMEKK